MTSSVTGPGANATVTAIPTSVSGSQVTLTPPSAALTAANVTYPEYIDPAFSVSASAYAYTESYHATTTAYMPSDDLKLGLDDWTTDCGSPCWENGITRSYLKFSNVAQLDGKNITDAHLVLSQVHNSCSGTYTYTTAITNQNASFTSSLDWNNQPAASGITDSAGIGGGSGGKIFEIPTIGAFMAAHNYTTANMVMYAADESNDCAYRRFAISPSLSVTYVSTPAVPTNLAVNNATASYPCSTTSPGPAIPNATGNHLSLSDSVTSPDTGGLTANFEVSADGGSTYTKYTGAATVITANSPVPATATVTVADGTTYRWYASTTAGVSPFPVSAGAPSGAPGNAGCFFHYDATAPTAPTISSPSYPVNGPTTVTSGGSGNLTVTASDPGTNPSGLTAFNYDIDGTGIATGGTHGTIAATQPSTPLAVPLSALHWGTNTVFIQSVDAAGNVSTVQPYNFYVQQAAFGAYHPGTAGDIDGDNIPDLVTVDATGDIQLYHDPGPGGVNPTGNLTTDPHQFGGRVLVPANQTPRWPAESAAGAIIAHAGSFAGNNDDDLIIAENGTLYIGRNPGTSGTWSFANVTRPTCSACGVAYNPDDWSSVVQMVAVPASTASGPPSIITLERFDGTTGLWLFTPISGRTAFNPPTQLSTDSTAWHWDRKQLLMAGPLPGITGTSLVFRSDTDGGIAITADITALRPAATPTATTVVSGFTADQAPLIGGATPADPNGAWAVYSTDSSGTLWLDPATTGGGTTTWAAPVQLSTTANWGSHQLALGNNYTPPDNVGIVDDGATNKPFDTATTAKYGYSSTAIANAGPDNQASFLCLSTFESTACADHSPFAIFNPNTVTGASDIYVTPNIAAGSYNNFVANGQSIPVPTSGDTPNSISFLGAAATTSASGASVSLTITFTDGDTQNVTVTLPDWAQNTDTTPVAGDTCVLVSSYRDDVTAGTQNNTPVRLFATPDIQLVDNGQPPGVNVQIASIHLGTNNAVHIFSTSVQ